MGFTGIGDEVASLVKRLAVEYNLDIDPESAGYKNIALWNRNDGTAEQRIRSAADILQHLKPGRYFFVEHPGMNTSEMQGIWHKGYENVASDRDAVTKVFTSKELMDIIGSEKIVLVSYKDAKL
jgi:hypothetical protein